MNSSAWSSEDKVDGRPSGGQSRERQLSGASNHSLGSRPRGPKEYGNRMFDGGRRSRGSSRLSEAELHRIQLNAYESIRHSPSYDQQGSQHSVAPPHLAQSVPGDMGASLMQNRQQWAGSNLSLASSHRSHSGSRRSPQHQSGMPRTGGYHQNNGDGRQRREGLSASRKSPNSADIGSKLDDRQADGPISYTAAGTAPVRTFRGTVSPVPSLVSTPISSSGVSSQNKSYSRSSQPYSQMASGHSTDSQQYRKQSGPPMDVSNCGQMQAGAGSNNRNRDGGAMAKRGSGHDLMQSQQQGQLTSADFFVHTHTEHERTVLATLNVLSTLQQELIKAQGSGGGQQATNHTLSRLMSEAELRQALERIAALSKDEQKRYNGEDNDGRWDHQQPGNNTRYGNGMGVPAGAMDMRAQHQTQGLYPNVVGRNMSSRGAGNNQRPEEHEMLAAGQQTHRMGEETLPMEMMPIMMRVMQQQSTEDDHNQQQQQSQWKGGMQQQSSGGHYMNSQTGQKYQQQTNSSMNQQMNGGNNIPAKQYLNYSAAVARSSNSSSSQHSGTSHRAKSEVPSTAYAAKAALQPRKNREEDTRSVDSVLLPLVDRSAKYKMTAPLLPINRSRSKDQAEASKETSKETPTTTTQEGKRTTQEEEESGMAADESNNEIGESGYQSEPSPPLPVERQQYNGNNKNKKTGVAASPLLTSSSSTNSKSIDSAVVEQSTVASSLPASLPSHPPALSSLSRPGPPPSSPLNGAGQFEVSKMDVLSEEIWHYHNSVTQTTSMLNRKLHLRDMLYYSICPVFPMCGLYVVGSSLNGFGNNSSDMDLCLMITNKDLDQKTDAVVVLNMILSALSQLDWVSHQKLILAKVPILRVKFTAPFADITVDLNANNSVAIKNTHLLCYYSSFDWRVRPLVSVVKEWAKRKGINDAKGSSFTSYSLVLMVIHYLQCGADPAVLPCLQQLYPKRFSNKCDVRTLNVTMPLQAPQTDDWHYSEKATLGELLIGFLDYYANKFDYDRDAISVRQGKRVDRAVMARNRPSGQANSGTWRSQWRCICIEEPFTLSNTAHSIYDEMVFGAIKDAFGEAHVELERSRDLKSLLSCKPITAHVVGGGAVCFAYEGSSRSSHHLAQPPSAESPPLFCQLTNEGGAELTNERGGGVAVVPSGSANSLNTAEGGSSSSGSSSNGEEQDHDRLSESRCGLMSSSASSLHQNRSGSLPRSSGGRPRSNRKQRTPLVPARV